MKHFVALVEALAWPVLIGGIVWAFYEELRQALRMMPELSKRLSKAGPVEFQQTASVSLDDKRKQIDAAGISNVAPMTPDPDIAPYENDLRRALTDNNVINAPDIKDRLIRAVAYGGRIAEFEGTRWMIFGTQFAALKAMKERGPLTATDLQSFYVEHVTRMKNSGLTYGDILAWLGFLTNSGLVQHDPDGRYSITEKGERFLKYGQSVGLTEAKAY
jgi:hypothetical protein